jgi:hypothetical protein
MTKPRHPIAVKANDPARAGKTASRRMYFGDLSRFAVYAIHTRHEAVTWIVTDADTPDPLFPDFAAIIRQAASFQEAIAGL